MVLLYHLEAPDPPGDSPGFHTLLDADFRSPDGAIDRYMELGEHYTDDSVAKLKVWLPEGMAMSLPAPRTSKSKKAA